jgi:hypothetical protein
VALPVAILYLPATHAVHAPPFGPVNPTLQVQAVRATLEIGELELVGHPIQVVATVAPAVVEYVPAAQSVQTALPVVVLYLPAAHCEHTPPLGPVNPALQVQAVRATLEIGELELVGHVVHAAVRMKTFAPIRNERTLVDEPVAEPCACNILLAAFAGSLSITEIQGSY